MKNARRGSVLMEMVVVLPIYLILFGGVCIVGELLAKSIQVSFGDRTAAHDVQSNSGGWNEIVSSVLNLELDNPICELYEYYADQDFQGPWALCAGAKATDRYTTFDGPRNQLRFSERFVNNATEEASIPGLAQAPWNQGTVDIVSKDIPEDKDKKNARKYNYYTYKRVRYSSGDLKKIYRAMPESPEEAGRLVDAMSLSASWKRGVVDESYPNTGGDESNHKTNPPKLENREYHRYGTFVSWSE